MSLNKILYALPAVLIAGIVFYFVYALYEKDNAPSPFVGKEIPEFSLSTTGNSDFTQEDLKGQPSLVTFFASWCLSCRLEHKMISTLSKKHNLPLYGVAYRDTEKAIETWLDKFGDPFIKIGYDVLGAVGMTWSIAGVPETFLVDEKGIVRHHVRGALINDAVIDDLEKAIRTVSSNTGSK